ncbi:Dihydrofolate synthase @ Folylpolyglutamate synthase [hydrothermal vent metagenome]|uniref:tetrahydrofolate synthase n=1 Tax=hydrothermal vent metagenome TaxID=652676 RepID=A0A3B0QP48_9ZZZZ
MPRLTPSLKYLYSLRALGIKPGLRRIELLLSLLGNPEKTYPTVIVAGTNGKGSTSAMIASVLTEAGYKVGHYSSPHLARFNERLRVSGEEVTGRELSALIRRMRTLVEEKITIKKDRPSFFEFATAMAFEHFRKKKVDIAVLEVGMGGRFDATNVTNPLVSVVTSIALDHKEYLGDTIEEVAGEKAGVIKKDGVLVTTVRVGAALSVIKKAARENKAAAYYLGKDFRVVREKGRGQEKVSYDSAGLSLPRLSLGLKGGYQAENAGAAIKTLELLNDAGFSTGRSALRSGLRDAVWPGRFDLRLAKKRSVRVVFDCAHNEAGAKALRAALLEITPYERVFFVIGVMADKDVDAILSSLLPGSGGLSVTEPASERSADLVFVQERAKKLGFEAAAAGSVEMAVAARISAAPPRSVVCVTGSIFTVGEALGSSVVTKLLR